MDYYKVLLLEVEEKLKSKGFTKKGNTFYLFENNNWALLNFQKSKNSSSTRVTFTINIGVLSTALRKIIDNTDIAVKPSIEDCQWKKRIGFLLPEKQDYWWEIDNDSSLKNLIAEITKTITTFAIPEIENHISDENLEKEWLRGIAEGATEFQRYVYLTTLLKLHKKENLALLVEELKSFSKGKPYEYAAQEHIKSLETYE